MVKYTEQFFNKKVIMGGLLLVIIFMLIINNKIESFENNINNQYKINNNQTGNNVGKLALSKTGQINEYDYIDVIYYINLDKRIDRNNEFLEEMKKAEIPSNKIIRIPAVYKPKQGDLGCSMSHIKTLELFISSGSNNCIVFEDDFEFTKPTHTIKNMIRKLFNNAETTNFDVCMLSANESDVRQTSYDFVKKVFSAQTTSGYMVSKTFAPILLQNFKDGAQKLLDSYKAGNPNGPEYCIDQYWKRLQPDNNWLLFQPKLGKQRTSYSDIQGGVIKMTV